MEKKLSRYQGDPVGWAHDILGVKLWRMQEEILVAMVDGDVVVKSGHGMGKDFLGAVLVLWFLCNFRDSLIICTAPCFDKETEVLTTGGWKYLSNLGGGEKIAIRRGGKLVYERPEKLHRYKVCGELVGHKSRDIDFLVTPNHKLFIKKNWHKCKFEKKEAQEVYGKWFNAFNREVVWEGEEDSWTERHYELWGFWFANGYCGVGGKQRRCDVTLTQKNFPDYAKGLLGVYGKEVFEYQREDGAYNFVVYDKEISTWFANNFLDKRGKRIPQFIKMTTKEKLRAFINGVFMGDGDKGNEGTDRIRVYGDEQFANDLQEICMKAGYVCNLHKRVLGERAQKLTGREIKGKPTIEYSVSMLSDRKMFPRSRKPSWYKKHYDDYVYCVTVSSGIVLVRRNGTYHWSGNSARQVEKVMWGEIANLYYRSRVELGGKLMSQELRMGPKWYATGFTTKETNQQVGKTQGFHAAHQLVVMTEAQAIEEVVFNQLDGVLVGGHSRRYIAGNPLMSQGYFWRLFNDVRAGTGFKKFTFSCYDAPNVIEGRDVIPGMVSKEWIADKEIRWGRESPLFQGRVLGEFPGGSVKTLVSMEECQRSMEADPLLGLKVVGVDPARYGDDDTAFAVAYGGELVYLHAENGKATPETEGEILNVVGEHKAEKVVIDEGCMGGGIVDHVEKELGEGVELLGVPFGGRASDLKFANIATEMWWEVCDAIKKGKIKLPDEPDLFTQLCNRKYKFNLKGQLILESKEEMKKRGLPSPNLADAAILALFFALEETLNNPLGASRREIAEEDKEFDTGYIKLDRDTGYPVDMFL